MLVTVDKLCCLPTDLGCSKYPTFSKDDKATPNFIQWQTTWDRSKLMTRQPVNDQLPINFHSPGPIGQASIVIEDDQTFQNMDGFGASLSIFF